MASEEPVTKPSGDNITHSVLSKAGAPIPLWLGLEATNFRLVEGTGAPPEQPDADMVQGTESN